MVSFSEKVGFTAFTVLSRFDKLVKRNKNSFISDNILACVLIYPLAINIFKK